MNPIFMFLLILLSQFILRIIFILFKPNKKVNVDKVIKNERIHCFFRPLYFGFESVGG